jgi:hypothetical protein
LLELATDSGQVSKALSTCSTWAFSGIRPHGEQYGKRCFFLASNLLLNPCRELTAHLGPPSFHAIAEAGLENTVILSRYSRKS